jgi:hypothetical protein
LLKESFLERRELFVGLLVVVLKLSLKSKIREQETSKKVGICVNALREETAWKTRMPRIVA